MSALFKNSMNIVLVLTEFVLAVLGCASCLVWAVLLILTGENHSGSVKLIKLTELPWP